MAGADVVEEEIELPRNARRDRHHRIEEARLVLVLGANRLDEGQEQRAYSQEPGPPPSDEGDRRIGGHGTLAIGG